MEIASGVDEYYSTNSVIYRALQSKIEGLIQDLLLNENIVTQSIRGRIKDITSFKEKISRKKYQSPEDVQDLLGLRIICYIKLDVQNIVDIIYDNFHVIDFVDKSKALGIKEAGYNAIHLICKLSTQRCSLSDYSKYEDCFFEIQVGTILAHAWAEIEHDKIYKLKNIDYPDILKRRLTLLSGTLELCDSEFERISDEIRPFTRDVTSRIDNGDLNIPITISSLRIFMRNKFQKISFFEPRYGLDMAQDILQELRSLEIHSVESLNALIPSNFIERILELDIPMHGVNISRLITHILIINDASRFFGRAWMNRFSLFDSYDHLVFTEFGVNIEEFPEEIHFDCHGL